MRNVSAIDVARGSAINLYDTSSVLQATLVAATGGVSITGSITGSSTVQGTRLISTIGTGTAPLTVTSTTMVANLNVERLNGQQGSYYLDTSAGSQTKSGGLTIGAALTVTTAFTLINGTNDVAASLGPTATGNTGNASAINLRSGNGKYLHFVMRGDAHASQANCAFIFNYDGTTFNPAIAIGATGNVGIGTSSVPTSKFSVETGGTNRRLIVGSSTAVDQVVLIRGDDNTVGPALRLQNLDTTDLVQNGFRLRFDLATNASATAINAGSIDVVKEAVWTATTSTQDSYMAFSLAENGSLAEKVRISSGANLGIGTNAPVSSGADGRVVHIASATRTEFRAVTSSAATFRAGATIVGYVGTENSTDFIIQTNLTTRCTVNATTGVFNFTVVPTVAGNTMWHAGNDGSGSGLDADLWQGNTTRSLLSVTGSAAFGGAYWSGTEWVHDSATADYAFTFRHDASDAGSGGAFQVLLFPTVSTGAGTSAGSPQYFQFRRDGTMQVPNLRVTGLATGVMRAVSGGVSTVMTGTAGYVTRWTANDNIGVGTLQDDATNVAVGGAPGTYKFRVYGTSYISSNLNVDGDITTIANFWLSQGNPRIIFDETDGGTNQRYWDFVAQSGVFYGRLYEDNRLSGVVTNWVAVTRSATTISRVEFGGPVFIPSGSASAPALTFTADTNTGLYNTSDVLYVAAGGIEIARFYSGAIVYGDIATDAATKTVRFMTRHYTNAEEPLILAVCQSSASGGTIDIGGGTSLGNAATSFRIYVATNNTTIGTDAGLKNWLFSNSGTITHNQSWTLATSVGSIYLSPSTATTYSVGHIYPSTNHARDLGDVGAYWRTTYSDEISWYNGEINGVVFVTTGAMLETSGSKFYWDATNGRLVLTGQTTNKSALRVMHGIGSNCGVEIGSTDDNEGWISFGTEILGNGGGAISTYTARATSSSLYHADNELMTWYNSTSLTLDATYTPTPRMRLDHDVWQVGTRVPIAGVAITPLSGGSLTVSTVYYWVVTAVDSYGETLVSSEVTMTPTSGTQTAQIFWNKSAGASNYRLYRRTSAMTWSDGNAKLVATLASTVTSYSDTGAAASAGVPTTTATMLGVSYSHSSGELTISGRTGIMSACDPDYALTVAGGDIAGSSVVSAGAKIGSLVLGSSGSGYGVVGDNVRFSATSGTFNYDRADFASAIDFDSGTIRMRTASSGSAGGTISFNTRLQITNAGSVVLGTAALATTATDGFLYIPTCAGAPTGVPTAQTGRSPIIVDTSNLRIYAYIGGSWRYAALT